MYVRQESYGFTVYINRRGMASIRLTFEELPTTRVSSRQYLVVVDKGWYTTNSHGFRKFEIMGSFVIPEWVGVKKNLRLKSRLRNIIGVSAYLELERVVEKQMKGIAYEQNYQAVE